MNKMAGPLTNSWGCFDQNLIMNQDPTMITLTVESQETQMISQTMEITTQI